MIINRPVPKRAFTIIEVVLFIAVFTTAIVLIFASVNYSALGLKNAQMKIMASHASEQLAEWLNYQRDSEGFSMLLGQSSIGGTTYCFNTSTPVWAAPGSCSDYSLNGVYRREAVLTRTADNLQLTATITTSWNSLGMIRNSGVTLLITNH